VFVAYRLAFLTCARALRRQHHACGRTWARAGEAPCSNGGHASALEFGRMRSVVSVPAVVVLACMVGCATARHDRPSVADPAGPGGSAANATPVANPQGGIDQPQPIGSEIPEDDCPERPSGGRADPRQALNARFTGTVVSKFSSTSTVV